MIKMVGFDMAKNAAQAVYEEAGVGPEPIEHGLLRLYLGGSGINDVVSYEGQREGDEHESDPDQDQRASALLAGTFEMRHGTVSGEDVGDAAGNDDANLIIKNSTIANNTARVGGGIYSISLRMTAWNSTFSGNWSVEWGGAIVNKQETLTIINSTITITPIIGITWGVTSRILLPERPQATKSVAP